MPTSSWFSLFLGALASTWCIPAAADGPVEAQAIYHWVDEQGVAHFTDQAREAEAATGEVREIPLLPAPSAHRPPPARPAPDPATAARLAELLAAERRVREARQQAERASREAAEARRAAEQAARAAAEMERHGQRVYPFWFGPPPRPHHPKPPPPDAGEPPQAPGGRVVIPR